MLVHLYLSGIDVCLGTKIRILKQITTGFVCKFLAPSMFVLAQRDEYKSKSQQKYNKYMLIDRCLSWHKDTNFKANHNGRAEIPPSH